MILSLDTTRAQVETQGPAIRLSEVTTGYRDLPAIEDVTLTVDHGTLTGIVGPNGSGKSTLIKTIVGILRPWHGTVALTAVDGSRARVGYVPQREDVDLSFPVTIFDVVMMGRYGLLGRFRRPGRRDREVVDWVIERVGLESLRDRPIGALSGGQRQRAFIARALAVEPTHLLLDEPLSGVDALSEEVIFTLLRSLRDGGMTVLMATHDLISVIERCDRCIAINRTVVAAGTPSDVLTKDVLARTFGTGLMLVEVGDKTFALDLGHGHHH